MQLILVQKRALKMACFVSIRTVLGLLFSMGCDDF